VSLSPRVASLIAERRLIEAIKTLRQETGLGLKEAKDIVDAYADGHPPAQGAVDERHRSDNGGLVAFVAVLALIAAAACAVLFLRR